MRRSYWHDKDAVTLSARDFRRHEVYYESGGGMSTNGAWNLQYPTDVLIDRLFIDSHAVLEGTRILPHLQP